MGLVLAKFWGGWGCFLYFWGLLRQKKTNPHGLKRFTFKGLHPYESLKLKGKKLQTKDPFELPEIIPAGPQGQDQGDP